MVKKVLVPVKTQVVSYNSCIMYSGMDGCLCVYVITRFSSILTRIICLSICYTEDVVFTLELLSYFLIMLKEKECGFKATILRENGVECK